MFANKDSMSMDAPSTSFSILSCLYVEINIDLRTRSSSFDAALPILDCHVALFMPKWSR